MTDYQPLIARAVEGLSKGTGEARRALYERARAALVTQLRAVDPPLSESEITTERLALEEAIRKVEGDAARKSRAEPRGEPRPPVPPKRAPNVEPANPDRSAAAAPSQRRDRPVLPPIELPPVPRTEATRPLPQPDAAADDDTGEAPTKLSARSRLLNARTTRRLQEEFKGFREIVREVDDIAAANSRDAQSAPEGREGFGAPRRPPLPEGFSSSPLPRERLPRHFDGDDGPSAEYEHLQISSLEPSFELDDEGAIPPHAARPAPPPREPDEDYVAPRRPRSYRGLARLAVVLIVLLGLAATVSWQWSNIATLYQHFFQLKPTPPAETNQAPAQAPKFSGRVPQEQVPGQAPAPGGAPGTQPAQAPAVAQRVVLYEEDSNDPQGKRYVGSAIWRTETVSPGPGLAPELAVRADIEIPDRRMTVTWSLRRNTDKALPASHTIEIMFNLPADFPGGGIANVPGVLMKQAEQARGTPLAGLAVKVTNGFFLIGLSAVDADVQRNLQLLKDQEWFDIPIVYTNGGRAILAVEKGPPGDRAFAEAFAAWGK